MRWWLTGLILIECALSIPLIFLRPSTDEPTWVSNGIKFQRAILQRHWQNTRLTTRPGVSVEWVVGLSELAHLKTENLLSRPIDELSATKNAIITARFGIALTLLLLNICAFMLLTRIMPPSYAAFTALLISLHPIFTEPYYLAWTDMLLSYFILLTVVSFVVYIKKPNVALVLTTSAFFAAGILTKIIAWTLLPSLAMIAIFFSGQKNQKIDRSLSTILIVAVALFYLLYPAAWFKPLLIFDRVQEVTTTYSSPYAINSIQHWWDYPLYALLIDPPLFVLSITAIYGIARLKIKNKKTMQHPVAFFSSASIYLAAIYATSFLKDGGLFVVRSDRYIAPAIPLFLVGMIHFFAQMDANEKRFHFTPFAIATLAVFYIFNLTQILL